MERLIKLCAWFRLICSFTKKCIFLALVSLKFFLFQVDHATIYEPVCDETDEDLNTKMKMRHFIDFWIY